MEKIHKNFDIYSTMNNFQCSNMFYDFNALNADVVKTLGLHSLHVILEL